MSTEQYTMPLHHAPFVGAAAPRTHQPEATPLSLNRKAQQRRYRRMLLLGGAISAAAHAALIFGTTGKPAPSAKASAPAEPMELLLQVPPPPLEAEAELPSFSDQPPTASLPAFAPVGEIPSIVEIESSTILMPVVPAVSTVELKTLAARFSGVGTGSQNWNRTLFRVGDLDQKPIPVAQQAPRYPTDMMRARIEGEVLVQFVVDANGRVQNEEVIHSTHAPFEQPALQAVRKWHFKPGKRGGKAVATLMEIPIGFSLADNR